MDTNLMPACDIIGCNEKGLKDIDYCEMVRIIKDIQLNAIEVAVQRCSEEAGACFEDKDGLEYYINNTSILDCKQKLFEENNLI